MPGPSSVTVSTASPASPASTARAVETVVPGGVWVRALARRLASTWCSRVSSPATWTASGGRSRRQRWSGPAACASPTTSTTSADRSTGVTSSGRPSSSRASSSRSSTRVVIRALSDSTRRSACATSGGTSSRPRRVSSAYPRIAASGVRSSWLASDDELADPRLAGLAGGQRPGDVAEHAVERRADLTDLGARVGVGLRHPDRQRDLAPVQRQLGDPPRGGRDPAERAQGAADQVRAGEPGEQQPGAGDGGLEGDHRPQCPLDVGQRQPGDPHVATLDLLGDHPVVAQRAEVDRARSLVGGQRGQPRPQGLGQGRRLAGVHVQGAGVGHRAALRRGR